MCGRPRPTGRHTGCAADAWTVDRSALEVHSHRTVQQVQEGGSTQCLTSPRRLSPSWRYSCRVERLDMIPSPAACLAWLWPLRHNQPHSFLTYPAIAPRGDCGSHCNLGTLKDTCPSRRAQAESSLPCIPISMVRWRDCELWSLLVRPPHTANIAYPGRRVRPRSSATSGSDVRSALHLPAPLGSCVTTLGGP